MDNANKKNRKDHKKDHKKGQKGQKGQWSSFKEPDYFTTSLTGFLITSNQNKEKNAVRDAFNFLNKVELSYGLSNV